MTTRVRRAWNQVPDTLLPIDWSQILVICLVSFWAYEVSSRDLQHIFDTLTMSTMSAVSLSGIDIAALLAAAKAKLAAKAASPTVNVGAAGTASAAGTDE